MGGFNLCIKIDAFVNLGAPVLCIEKTRQAQKPFVQHAVLTVLFCGFAVGLAHSSGHTAIDYHNLTSD